jgi:pimeloyl-ACP methyl ester carboxylesterase
VPNLPETLVSGKEKAYLSNFYNNAYQKTAMAEEDIDRYVASYARPESLHAGFEYYRAFEQDARDNAEDSTALSMPVLALGGEYSPWKEHPYVQLQGLADSLEGDVVPECGHFIQEEQPEWLAARLRKFFESKI